MNEAELRKKFEHDLEQLKSQHKGPEGAAAGLNVNTVLAAFLEFVQDGGIADQFWQFYKKHFGSA